VTVNTGFFGLSSSFAPLAGSSLEGDRLTLAADKDTVKDAPNVDEDGHITREQEDELYRYYQVDSTDVGTDRMRTRPYGHDHDHIADGQHRPDGPLFDKDRDGRGPVGEVLDGPDRGRDQDRPLDRDIADAEVGGGPLDQDRHTGGASAREGNAPAGIEGDPAYRNDPAFIQDQAAEGNESYVDNERLQDERHDEPGLADDYAGGDVAGRPDAADGAVADRRRGADPIDGLLDDPDADGRRNI
ncbi:MAG: hypothetical protein Q4F67_17025, partial [Propionibacteriaceae bacterium]|nr:hypothetical protein [Propionibacteriaceae bacterium]